MVARRAGRGGCYEWMGVSRSVGDTHWRVQVRKVASEGGRRGGDHVQEDREMKRTYGSTRGRERVLLCMCVVRRAGVKAPGRHVIKGEPASIDRQSVSRSRSIRRRQSVSARMIAYMRGERTECVP